MATGISTADAVVIGSGAFGASTAYHLTRRGLKVALVDQHALGSQTSPRAAGLTSKADPMPTMARLRHEARVVERDAEAAAEGDEQAHVRLAEGVFFFVVADAYHAQRLPSHQDRHRQEGFFHLRAWH